MIYYAHVDIKQMLKLMQSFSRCDTCQHLQRIYTYKHHPEVDGVSKAHICTRTVSIVTYSRECDPPLVCVDYDSNI